MRLVDLEPRWWVEDRCRIGFTFLCPHCVRLKSKSPARIAVAFKNPLDGANQVRLGIEVNLRNVHDRRLYDVPPGFHWTRIGDTFAELTIRPSVDASASGHCHGHIALGETSP